MVMVMVMVGGCMALAGWSDGRLGRLRGLCTPSIYSTHFLGVGNKSQDLVRRAVINTQKQADSSKIILVPPLAIRSCVCLPITAHPADSSKLVQDDGDASNTE